MAKSAAVMRKIGTGERVTIEDLIAEGDKVVARLSWHREERGTSRETIDILRVAHGRVVEHWGTHT